MVPWSLPECYSTARCTLEVQMVNLMVAARRNWKKQLNKTIARRLNADQGEGLQEFSLPVWYVKTCSGNVGSASANDVYYIIDMGYRANNFVSIANLPTVTGRHFRHHNLLITKDKRMRFSDFFWIRLGYKAYNINPRWRPEYRKCFRRLKSFIYLEMPYLQRTF